MGQDLGGQAGLSAATWRVNQEGCVSVEDAGPGGEPEEEEDRGGRGAQTEEGRGPGVAGVAVGKGSEKGEGHQYILSKIS